MNRKAQVPARTPEQAAQWFLDHGIAVAKWARDNGFKRHTVVDLLSGRRVGRRGEAHLAAIALGLKPDPAKKAR